MSRQHQEFVNDLNYHSMRMENNFSSKKSMIILVIVVGCFAVLWPKIFYPMLVGSANEHMKPSSIDKNSGCCYVLSESDVDTIKIMSELCGNIIRDQMGDLPLTGKQIIKICQDEVFRTCGIDVSLVLQQQVRLGHTTKQILDEIRSLNGSLCLKYNFGVDPWRLGVPHFITTVKNSSQSNVRQERPPHVRSEMLHPAFRERGRAIPMTSSPSQPPPRIIQGRPGPIPGMRPTLGGAGHVVPNKQSTGGMNVIMPLYTVGIVIFFTYTLMKIIFKKHPDTDTMIYSSVDYEEAYKKKLYSENGSRDAGSCKLVVNAMSALLDQVDHEIEVRRYSSEIANQEDNSSSNLYNGTVKKEEKPSVKIMGMETSESCEGGKKWQSASSFVLPTVPSKPIEDLTTATQEIYLDRTLPPQSQLLVTESAIETEKPNDNDDAIVLAGKMTLSVISLENENLEITSNQKEDEMEENSETPIEKEIQSIIEEAIDNLTRNNDASNNSKDEDNENEEKECTQKAKTPMIPSLSKQSKSSSEESGNTVLSNSNQGSVVNVNLEDDDAASEESEVSEEEISNETDEEKINRNSNTNERRVNGVVINGVVSQDKASSEEDSEEEIVEEIIEEYSEEEISEDDADDKINLSRNGNN